MLHVRNPWLRSCAVRQIIKNVNMTTSGYCFIFYDYVDSIAEWSGRWHWRQVNQAAGDEGSVW